MTESYPLRPITPDQFSAFGEVLTQAFNDAGWPAEAIEQERLVFEFDRSLAAFDGDAMVGTAGAYSFQLAVPGGIAGAAGGSFVILLPCHRRRGILSAMMRHQLDDIAARGEAIAALFASESGIYGRYGYGCASGQLRLTIRRGEGALSPAAAGLSAGTGHGSVRLRAGQPTELRAELAKLYDSAAPHRPGMMARDERWWQNILADPEFTRREMGALKCLLAEDDSGPRGYAGGGVLCCEGWALVCFAGASSVFFFVVLLSCACNSIAEAANAKPIPARLAIFRDVPTSFAPSTVRKSNTGDVTAHKPGFRYLHLNIELLIVQIHCFVGLRVLKRLRRIHATRFISTMVRVPRASGSW